MEFFTLAFWKGLWDDFTEYLDDKPVAILKDLLDAIVSVLETITPPDFMDTPISDQMGPVMEFIGYFMSEAGLTQAFAMIASAYMFRLGRKAITLGRW